MSNVALLFAEVQPSWTECCFSTLGRFFFFFQRRATRRNTAARVEIKAKEGKFGARTFHWHPGMLTNELLPSSRMQDAVFFRVHVLFRKKLQQYFSYVIVMYSAAHEIAHRQANLEEPCPFFFFPFLLQALSFTSGEKKKCLFQISQITSEIIGFDRVYLR